MHPMNMVRDRTIYKFDLGDRLATPKTIKLPVGAEIIHAALQNGEIRIWSLQDKEERWFKNRTFIMYGTGWDIPFEQDLKHINTIFDGGFVWHIFEVL